MPHRPRALLRTSLLSVLGLAACASTPEGGGVTDKALGWIGLQTRQAAAATPAAPSSKPKRVAVRLHAGDVLNTDPAGRSLALVAKLYALKDPDAFLASRYDEFKGTTPGPGMTELREIVLTPGRRYESVETLGDGVRYIGIVALFRTPDEKRWRFAFDAETAAATGLTLGAHGCALSVSEGQPLGANAESTRLAGMHCH